MSNLAPVLRDLGRVAEASALTRRVEQLQPHPPFSFFDRGLAAMRAGDYAVAKENFAREVARAPYSSEFHFWLAVANLRLGDLGEAKKHMSDAVEASTSRGDHDLYAAKLAQIKAARAQ
jgi:tetratricopeptide (TPR) repeat protein